jgi:cardiolipin synthase
MRLRFPKLPGRRSDEQLRSRGDWSYLPLHGRRRTFNSVTPLRAGRETFPAMLEAIAGARKHVHLETYILRADGVGERFKTALIERAQAGVVVRLMYDALGSFGLSSAYVTELEAAGVVVVVFHPMVPWRPRWGLNRRDHQKILVADDVVAFTGGINIGDEYMPVEEGGGGWHDMHARIEGPAVHDLARVFQKTWDSAGGPSFPRTRMTDFVPLRSNHLSYVQVISNIGVLTRSRMRHAYLHAIRRADHTIRIMNAYFIPDLGLRRAFVRAVRRGVSVSVIVPSTSDVPAVYYASRHLYSRLMRAGVRIFEWPERMMHAKMGAIDGVWSTIGTYNLDRRSFLHNLEVGLITIDRDLAAELEAQFDADLANCREIVPAEWEKRSLWQKFLERLAYQFRYWL